MSVRIHAGLLALALSTGCQGNIGNPTAMDPDPPGEVEKCPTCIGVSPLARLTRAEYEGTVRRVFGDTLADTFAFERLPGDGTAGAFSSNANLLVDEDSVQAYRDVAERAAPSLAEAATCSDRTCVEDYLEVIGAGLFRRPMTTEESSAFLHLYDGAESPEVGVRLLITALLQSPQFLYRIELGDEIVHENTVALTGQELATRLAYFFWRESPDDALLAAADAGDLDTVEGVRHAATRLFDDPRADRMIRDFYRGWLGLQHTAQRDLDAEDYPEFEGLRDDMMAETETFTLALMRGSADYRALLTADYTYASDALAAHYGASAGEMEEGVALPRVSLDGTRRSGLLTQAAVVVAHTSDEATAGVHRGKFLRESFLCLTLPPPPDVDAIVEPDPNLSTRERFEAKTSPPGCINCHALLNPAGFLLEHYDLMGGWRDMDGSFPIDASGGLPGSDIYGDLDGAIQLGDALADSPMAHECIVRQWFRYAMARKEAPEDGESIDAVLTHFTESGLNLRELVIELTTTPAFRLRRAPLADESASAP